MKLSIILISALMVLTMSTSGAFGKCTPWYDTLKTKSNKTINFIKDSWEDAIDGVKQQIAENDFTSLIQGINIKRNITGLFKNLNVSQITDVVDHMLANGTTDAIIDELLENPDIFEPIIQQLPFGESLNLELIINGYQTFREFLNVDTHSPRAFADAFPRTPEEFFLKVVRLGIIKQFPDSVEFLEEDTEKNTVPFIMSLVTQTGDKYPKYKKLTQLINFVIDVTDAATNGRAFKPIAKLVDKLEEAFEE